MGQHIQLTTQDGFSLSAYQALPEKDALGGIVILQEIFGVNAHIREVVDGYAELGYAAIAPAIFDRLETGVELEYNEDGIERGLKLARQQLSVELAMLDIEAAAHQMKSHGSVATIGYCFGGFLAYLAACQDNSVDCSIAYYGGGITNVLDQHPGKPMLFHFAEQDHSIPLSDVDKVKVALPNAPLYIYPADHGFNCNHRGAWHEESALLARDRTLEFLNLHF